MLMPMWDAGSVSLESVSACGHGNASREAVKVLYGTLKMTQRGMVKSRRSYLYLPTPSTRAGYDTRSILMRSLTGLNSEFSFS